MHPPRCAKCLFIVFAFLVADCARSLASRLAGSLALAAATGNSALFKRCSVDRLNVLHNIIPPYLSLSLFYHILLSKSTFFYLLLHLPFKGRFEPSQPPAAPATINSAALIPVRAPSTVS